MVGADRVKAVEPAWADHANAAAPLKTISSFDFLAEQLRLFPECPLSIAIFSLDP